MANIIVTDSKLTLTEYLFMYKGEMYFELYIMAHDEKEANFLLTFLTTDPELWELAKYPEL